MNGKSERIGEINFEFLWTGSHDSVLGIKPSYHRLSAFLSSFVQILSDFLMLQSSFQDAKSEYMTHLVTTGAFLFFFD